MLAMLRAEGAVLASLGLGLKSAVVLVELAGDVGIDQGSQANTH